MNFRCGAFIAGRRFIPSVLSIRQHGRGSLYRGAVFEECQQTAIGDQHLLSTMLVS